MKTFSRLDFAIFNAWILRDCSTNYDSLWWWILTPFITSRSELREEDLNSPTKDYDDIQDLKEQVDNLSCLLKELQLQKEKNEPRDKSQVWAIDIKL